MAAMRQRTLSSSSSPEPRAAPRPNPNPDPSAPAPALSLRPAATSRGRTPTTLCAAPAPDPDPNPAATRAARCRAASVSPPGLIRLPAAPPSAPAPDLDARAPASPLAAAAPPASAVPSASDARRRSTCAESCTRGSAPGSPWSPSPPPPPPALSAPPDLATFRPAWCSPCASCAAAAASFAAASAAAASADSPAPAPSPPPPLPSVAFPAAACRDGVGSSPRWNVQSPNVPAQHMTQPSGNHRQGGQKRSTAACHSPSNGTGFFLRGARHHQGGGLPTPDGWCAHDHAKCHITNMASGAQSIATQGKALGSSQARAQVEVQGPLCSLSKSRD